MTLHGLACALSDRLAAAAEAVWALPITIAVCIAAWIALPPTDPFNSAVSDVSLVMLVVLQRSGARDTRRLLAGNAEMVRALPEADEAAIDLGAAE